MPLINMHTPAELVALFKTEYPYGSTSAKNGTLLLSVPDRTEYLRVMSEATYGLGVAWAVALMGPSDWVAGEFDVVSRYSVTSVADFLNAMRHAWPVVVDNPSDSSEIGDEPAQLPDSYTLADDATWLRDCATDATHAPRWVDAPRMNRIADILTNLSERNER